MARPTLLADCIQFRNLQTNLRIILDTTVISLRYFDFKRKIVMNVIQRSEAIKVGLGKGFQDSSSQMAHRECYGYEVCTDGGLVVNPEEAKVVSWIFERYLAGDSLGKIAARLEKQGIPSPTGRPKWNREAIDKLLSNEKYTGRVLLQKTISTGVAQIENDGLMEQCHVGKPKKSKRGPGCPSKQPGPVIRSEIENAFSWLH